MPRSVPRRELDERLHWSTSGLSPCSSKSLRENVRANQPRSSCRRSGVITKAPGRGVVSNFIVCIRRNASLTVFANLGNRHEKAPSPLAHVGELFHDLVLQIPRQDEDVTRAR